MMISLYCLLMTNQRISSSLVVWNRLNSHTRDTPKVDIDFLSNIQYITISERQAIDRFFDKTSEGVLFPVDYI